MDRINSEIENLLKGVSNDNEKNELLIKFFKEKSALYAAHLRKLSLKISIL